MAAKSKDIKRIFISAISGFFILLTLFSTGCLKRKEVMDRINIAGGIVTSDTIWSGTVRIDEDVLVPEGIKLFIKPGTKILVKESESSRNEPLFLSSYTEILIRGEIFAEGTKERPIIFSGEGTAEDKIYWAGVILDGVKDGIFAFCRIENAYTGIDCIQSSAVINKSLFQGNKYGIICSGKDSVLTLTENVINKNTSGLSILSHSRSEVIRNVIRENEEDGIYLGHNVEIISKDNDVAGNKYDIRSNMEIKKIF